MELPFAIGVFLASLALTYFSCIRPMRRGQGRCGTCDAPEGMEDNRRPHLATDDARQRADIARLREDIESLKVSSR